MNIRSAGFVLAMTCVVLGFPFAASAQLVSTSETLALEDASHAQATVDEYLARTQVVAELAALGVDPELARLRVAALSTAELQELAGRVEEAPAGGDGILTVLGITFVVLLVLELLGVINIFNRP